MSNNVIIFDTTLRDGEQALQASLSVKEKLQIAYALERLGVDIIEAGFPVSSPGDFESVQTIAREIKNSRICALARCVDNDIDVAAESLNIAEAFRIHVFLATSALHAEHKLKNLLMTLLKWEHAQLNAPDAILMMLSFLAKMRGVPILIIYVALWKVPSTRAQQPLIFQTP